MWFKTHLFPSCSQWAFPVFVPVLPLLAIPVSWLPPLPLTQHQVDRTVSSVRGRGLSATGRHLWQDTNVDKREEDSRHPQPGRPQSSVSLFLRSSVAIMPPYWSLTTLICVSDSSISLAPCIDHSTPQPSVFPHSGDLCAGLLRSWSHSFFFACGPVIKPQTHH